VTTSVALVLIPDVVCVLICGVATVTDVRSYRIPNWLTLSGVIAGFVLNTTLVGVQLGPKAAFSLGFVSSLAGCLLLLLSFGVLGVINFVGFGDVKLMAAVGALLRWPVALWALAYVTIAGGVLALAYAVGRGQLGRVFANMFRLSKRLVGKKEQVDLHRIPYAAAILIGATWAALLKYVPALRIP
jgi:prepilin peptidase CpaA